MEKDLIFFGESGLTSTSAGHVANLAKEYIAGLEEFVNSLSFIATDVQLLISQETKTLTRGNDAGDLSKLKGALTKIAEAKSLIAWLREAIKAKEKMTHAITQITKEDWCISTGRYYPEFPSDDPYYTEEMEVNKMSIKDRNNYYKLQTYASVFGKVIHPDGPLSNARKVFADKLRHPTELQGSGRDGIIYSYSPTVTQKELEDTFFELQNAQRSMQAEFNKIAHTVKENVFIENNRRVKERNTLYAKYKADTEILNKEFTQYTETEIKKISDLKIIIPHDLEGIYNAVRTLGKNE